MNKLDALIAELCPQGVERKRLGDIGVVVRGNGLQKKDFTESGVGCIHYGQIYTYYGTCAYKTKSFVSHELAEKLQKVNKGDLVIAVTSENVEDVGKCVVWLGDEQIVTGAHAAIFRHNTLIAEEKLKPDETRKFVDNSFRDGVLKTTGTDVDRILPPVSRFGGGNRTAKKDGIIAKLQAFFDKYFGLI